jgi:hypothetical protein
MAKVSFVAVLLIMLASSTPAVDDKLYAYVWTPRSADIGGPGSSDYLLLEALLKLCKTEEYPVAEGDNLDYIIREHFLVSQDYRHAFRLYFRRILELNPQIKSGGLLRIGTVIRLPVGPKFGASELSDTELPPAIRKKTFTALSKKAYELGVATEEKIEHYATHSLRAYVSPTGGGESGDLFRKIEGRGLVYPIDLDKHPEAQIQQMQILTLQSTDDVTRAAVKVVLSSDPDNLLPGMFPVSAPTSVDCKQPCTSCATNLGIPNGTDISKARVLIEDTGIQPGLIDARHLIPQSSGDQGKDDSPESHGTFVYSEIAARANNSAPNVFGVIPKENVYVSRTVQNLGGKDYFSMPAIMNGWKAFSGLMSLDSRAAKTWVINVSAFGEPVPDLDHPPVIPNDGHILIVAAAGNHHSEDEPALQAFPRLSNGSTPLLITAALGTDGMPASYTNWNSTYVHLFAPGDCVCGTPGQIDGTSQAAPFVTTAAAVLASARPDWNPRYVMWRLISTADHPDALRGKAFGGTLNLRRALDTGIILEERLSATSTRTHHVNSLVYDANWKAAFRKLAINVVDKETLRLYSPTSGADANQICFAALQFLYFELQQVCVDSKSKLVLDENGSRIELTADQVLDVSLPMPSSDESNLPNVIVKGVGHQN